MSRDVSVSLVGNLTDDPVLRFTEGGLAVIRFGLAVNKSRKVGDGYEDEAHFFNVTAFGSLADNCGTSLSKGMRVIVTGELEHRRWEDKETNEKRSAVGILADNIGPDLRWATATVTRINKDGSKTEATRSQTAPAPADDDFWR